MSVLEQPRAVGLLLVADQLDRFVHARVGAVPGVAEVLQATQYVLVPAGRKRELQPGRVDDVAGALTPEQLSFEPFQHADRGVERRADRTVLYLAVPTAVIELLTKEPGDHAIDVLTEVRAEDDDHAVDARLDLTGEERLPEDLFRTRLRTLQRHVSDGALP